ncbi:MAG: hypothetical protein LBD04_09170 [Synergistaceae bacterium]|jgi:hypothetical protein|nr:hypothetical protein [Synergistaceae bacterium]
MEGVVLAVKKFMVSTLLAAAVLGAALSAVAAEAPRIKDLGLDHVKMKWWIYDYGAKNGTPFAVARKYYTNESIKQNTVDLLMSKFGISPEVASALYGTEYGYEYTNDGKQFAVTYLVHFTQNGEVIHRTIFDNSSEATKKAFVSVPPSNVMLAPANGAALAVPKATPK